MGVHANQHSTRQHDLDQAFRTRRRARAVAWTRWRWVGLRGRAMTLLLTGNVYHNDSTETKAGVLAAPSKASDFRFPPVALNHARARPRTRREAGAAPEWIR